MTVLGFWIIVLAFVTALAATFNYVRNAGHRRYILYPARVWVTLSAASIIIASGILLTMILLHDFSNNYVFGYSDKSLPLQFLISTFYAGQEGSFLFWALCSALISLWLSRFSGRRQSEPYVMGVFMTMQSLLLLLLIAKSPFRFVWDAFSGLASGQVPADGRGLNPLLQNIWMVIHPPVLFIGFAAMAVPFSFAVGGLWRKEYHQWVSEAFPWVLFASCALGLGLMLGAYWAYGVLGWGGYWGWDPVENSSLVPWLTSVALVHTLLAQRRSRKFVRTNFILAILSFFLVVYSTFLTRSGILGDSSVHSFTDPGATVYWMLVGFLAVIASLGSVFMILRRKELRPQVSEAAFVSRETALGAGTIALLLSAAVVLFGTSLPIISKTAVEPSFYDKTNLPIGIAIGLLIGLSLLVQWGMDDLKSILVRVRNAVIGAVVVTAVVWRVGAGELLPLVFVFSSAFAFFVNLEIALKTIKGGITLLGGKLAHIGMAVMFLGIIATGKYSTTKHVSLEKNVPQEALGYTLTFTGYQPTPDDKYAFNVVAERDGQKHLLKPVMFDAGQQGLMRNPDIASFLTKDLYISPVSVERPESQAQETYTLPKGETVSMGGVKATFVKFDMSAHSTEAMTGGGKQEMSIGSVLELSDGSSSETITPIARYNASGTPTYEASPSKLIKGNIRLVSMNVGMGGQGKSAVTVQVHRADSAGAGTDVLVVEASIKPYIGLLWGGTVVMIAGFIVAMFKRAKEA